MLKKILALIIMCMTLYFTTPAQSSVYFGGISLNFGDVARHIDQNPFYLTGSIFFNVSDGQEFVSNIEVINHSLQFGQIGGGSSYDVKLNINPNLPLKIGSSPLGGLNGDLSITGTLSCVRYSACQDPDYVNPIFTITGNQRDVIWKNSIGQIITASPGEGLSVIPLPATGLILISGFVLLGAAAFGRKLPKRATGHELT